MNTAIAQMMIIVNQATSAATLPRETLETFLRLLAPYAPHICEELWSRLGHDELIAHATWPVHDEALCIDDLIPIVIQVNGKKRDELQVPKDAEKEELEKLALASEKAQKHLQGREPKRVIVVPGRLVNIVG
jgi:leucyl-tRNA synthetase